MSRTRAPVPCTMMQSATGFPRQSGTGGMSFCAVRQLSSVRPESGILATGNEMLAMFAVALGASRIAGTNTSPATTLTASDPAITGPRNRSSTAEARTGCSIRRKLMAARRVAPTLEMANIANGLGWW